MIEQELEMSFDADMHMKVLNDAKDALLENANIHDVKSLIQIRQYCNNPGEFQIVDCYDKVAIDLDLYNKLNKDFPEYFV